MNLLTILLAGLTSTSVVKILSEKTGISEKTLKILIPIVAPILLKSLTSNASEKEGAASLLGALAQHKSTEKVDDQISNADTEDGAKIIKHILGTRQEEVTRDIAGQSGLSTEDVAKLLATLAPVLLSSLSAANSTEQQAAPEAPASPLSLMGLLGGQAPAPAPETTQDANINGSALLQLLAALAK